MAGGITQEELQLAARNHGMPLEALRHDLTPRGLHYLLIHYDIPAVDAAAFRLEVRGRVGRELSLSLADLRERERVDVPVTFECAGNGRAQLDPRPVSQPWLVEAVGTAMWTGTPVRAVLEEAGLLEDAVDVVFAGEDRGVEGGVPQRYERALPVAEALSGEPLLAYAMGGEPLPPQHGFPLRLVVPGWYGMTNVKWLSEIRVLDRAFDGYQHARAYRFMRSDDDPGAPVSRMEPRSLMVPPGVPDFMTRERFVAPGPVRLEGRAWSGWAPVEAVEVRAGDGPWEPAALEPPLGPAAWRRWTFDWTATPGTHVLACRARDATGRVQPDDPPWNVKGYANNAVHRVTVTVRDA
ncbi:MAG: sulfite oxidase [Solirubrobacterales bacterium]|nr:sulfite oxidase [Solirubrobacterales bacterium]